MRSVRLWANHAQLLLLADKADANFPQVLAVTADGMLRIYEKYH